ncbi:MAG: phosphotransferase [Pseudomonadota bacterium]
MQLPREDADFTVEWLNAAFQEGGRAGAYQVTDVKVSPLDVPGQTAEVVKLAVTWDSAECPLPSRFVAKYTSRNQAMIESVIKVYDQYRRETAFYQLMPEPGMAVPTCYFARHEPETQQFALLLNDLAPAVSPSWNATPEQVEIAASYLPAFHAKWWMNPYLREQDWLVQYDNHDFYMAAATAAAAAHDKITEYFGTDAAHTQAALALWLKKIDRIAELIANRPWTMVHADYHPKQMFFPTAAGGEYSVIDWQFCFVAQGAWDLVRIMMLGQDVESRRANQDQILTGYLDGLARHGVKGYDRAALDEDIRLGLVVNQMIMAVALLDTDPAIIEKECAELGVDFRDVLLLRAEAGLRDWGVVETLEKI